MIQNRQVRRRFFVSAACFLLMAQSILHGQSDLGLRIQIVAGNGAQNTIETIPPTAITIRVVDRDNRPVHGATVVFTAPEAGPSGDFPNGLNTLTTITDEDGLAIAPQYRANDIPGRYLIGVRADYLGEFVSAAIRQSNATPKKSLGKLIMITTAAAGAAGAALVLRKGGGGGSTSSSTATPSPTAPTISFGSATVAAPQP